jgi:hypothetical protein
MPFSEQSMADPFDARKEAGHCVSNTASSTDWLRVPELESRILVQELRELVGVHFVDCLEQVIYPVSQILSQL